MSKKDDKAMYFLAVIPPEPIYTEALEIKQLFAKEYNSKAALKSPPHITLHMPFRLKPEREALLSEALNEVAKKTEAIPIHLEGFDHFNQRTVFMNVLENEKLEELFKAIMKTMKVNFNIFNAEYKDRGYHPHLTVAFRDLKKEQFKQAWPSFEDRPLSYTFAVTKFSLLKHNGKYWEVYKDFELANSK